MRTRHLVASIAALSFVFATSASALVLTAKTDEQKHRRDVQKQIAKHTFCLAKVALKCEKKGATSDPECDLTTGTAAVTVDPKAAAKFPVDIAKCDSKLDLNKKAKTSNYQLIGCPGDCDEDPLNGLQQCADIPAYQANVLSTTNDAGAKVQIGLLGGLISGSCQTHTGLPATDEATIDCTNNDAKRLNLYAKGLNKCYELCENDYKNKKGNGGDNDGGGCLVTGTPDAAFLECVSKKADKQVTKVIAPGNAGLVKGLIDSALDAVSVSIYNRDDPTTDPDVNVCGTCGDNTREGTEECDGTDLGICGACNVDCTCM